MSVAWTEEEIQRYSRNILLPQVGGTGQQRLRQAKVLIVGVGGLGSPAAYYLAAAGVGTVGLIDADAVELSNLQRQILHTTDDIGRPKVISAREKLLSLNPGINVISYHSRFNAQEATKLVQDYDIIIDGVDNFVTRYLINDACVLAGKPFVHGGVLQFAGQVTTVVPGKSPCLRCLFPTPPDDAEVLSCAQAGVLGVVPGVIGALQANEVLKYILGIGELLCGRILTFDALHARFSTITVAKRLDCPLCGVHPTITSVIPVNGCDGVKPRVSP